MDQRQDAVAVVFLAHDHALGRLPKRFQVALLHHVDPAAPLNVHRCNDIETVAIEKDPLRLGKDFMHEGHAKAVFRCLLDEYLLAGAFESMRELTPDEACVFGRDIRRRSYIIQPASGLPVPDEIRLADAFNLAMLTKNITENRRTGARGANDKGDWKVVFHDGLRRLLWWHLLLRPASNMGCQGRTGSD